MSNEIWLHPDYRISRDANCWCLEELARYVRETDDPKGRWQAGEPYSQWQRPTYHANLEQLTDALLRRQSLSSHARTFEQMMDELRHFKDDVLTALREVVELHEGALQAEADSRASNGAVHRVSANRGRRHGT